MKRSVFSNSKLAVVLAYIFLLTMGAVFISYRQTRVVETPEQKTVRYFAFVRTHPPLLLSFLQEMPKGGDLHSHLSGAVYAESYINWAAQKGLCFDQKTFKLTICKRNKKGLTKDLTPARSALENQSVYRQLVDAWSMRNAEYAGQSGHDQFFASFDKFGSATDGQTGAMLAEVVSRAARGRLSYLELMLTPDNGGRLNQAVKGLQWDDNFDKMRQQMESSPLNNLIEEGIEAGRNQLNEAEKTKEELLRCTTQQPDPGCQVTVNYIYQVKRKGKREQVFGEMLMGFKTAQADPRVVGLNLVQEEDAQPSLDNFHLQMAMLDYFHKEYPLVHITLHAGELSPALVPPEDLRFHIRESIMLGHAERIGHGVDVAQEEDTLALLSEMAERKIMVEICLSSNDGILGIKGKQHPLGMYLQYQVPVALATDDEGVSRSDITREYLKAATEHELSYLQLKAMARTSLERSFINGISLWQDSRKFTQLTNQCISDKPEGESLSASCLQLMNSSPKAKLQWELEKEFVNFENRIPSPPQS